MRVKELVNDDYIHEIEEKQKNIDAEQYKKPIKKEIICRICLCDDISPENPLIVPCQVR